MPAPLAANGKWVVDYADNMCLFQRSYGTGPDAITIGFRPIPLSDQTEMVIASPKHVPERRNGQATVVSASRPPLRGDYNSYWLPARRFSLTTIYLDGRAEELAQDSELDLIIPAAKTIRFVPGGSPGASHALDVCQDDLLSHWGIDPKIVHGLRSPAKVTGAAVVFGPDSYPSEAIRANEQGRVVARFSISAAGKVTDCKPLISSASKTLDDATCRISRRLTGTPAVDADGKPVDSWAILAVHWILP